VSNQPFSLGEEASVAQDLRGTSPAAPRRLVALTTDDALAQSLADLARSGVDISVVPDAEALSEELLQSTSSIALIDAGTAGSMLEGLVDALATQFPDLRLLVAGHGTEQNQLATRISSGRVFRFVHKPASPQRLKLMVDAASRTSEPQRISVTQTVQVLADPLGGTQRAGGSSGRRTLPWLLIAAGVALAAVTAVLLLWPKGDATVAASSSTAPAAGPAQSAQPEVNDLVRRADQAFADGRYVASDGSSAAELYRDAEKRDPQDVRPRDGFTRSIEYGLRSAEQALLAANLDEASRIAASLGLLSPTNPRLSFLKAQIDKEQARANQDASARSTWEAKQAQIRYSLEQMQLRLDTNLLLEPRGDSALSHFRNAEAAGPGDPAVRNARDGLLAGLLNAADGRLEAEDAAGARRLLDAAASLNSGAPGLDPLRRRLAALNTAGSPAGTAAATAGSSTPEPVLTMPAPTAAPFTAPATAEPTTSPAAEPASGPAVVSATGLKVIRSIEPVYPQRALADLVSGWVDLEFTVTASGSVRDVIVLGSEPAKIFDSAATSAARRARFEPVVRDGAPVEQRVRQRVRFSAQDK
jgi:TonB family protein